MMFGICFVILFTMFSVNSIHLCDGIRGIPCCEGYMLDPISHKCIPCAKGFYGADCDIKCPYPAFVQACQSTCVCSVGYCDHANGCTQSLGMYKIYSTRHLDYQATTAELANAFTEIKITTNTRMKNFTNKSSIDFVPDKNKSKRISFLKFALIGLTVVFLFTWMIYLNIRVLEKRQIDINKE